MAVTFAALMCHAPIVHPEVAGAEAPLCAATTRAMREVAARVVAAKPDRVVLPSPHSPRRRHGWGAWGGRHRGDLSAFRAPGLAVDLPDAPEVAAHLGLTLVQSREPLDHGAVVPLCFLWEAGWRGPTAILAEPWEDDGALALGAQLAELDGSTAIVASGDMSHRLRPGSPAGYHARAASFDRAFVDALTRDDWEGALAAPWRFEAAEDVVESTALAMGGAGRPRNAELLCYEAPFGVGYAEAVLHDPAPPLYAVARQAIRAHLAGRRYEPPADERPAQGAFVTLHKDGELRGCVGSLAGHTGSLSAEVARMAPEAAFHDDRFPPLGAEELRDVVLEVSVLSPAETVPGPEALDPRRFGVIVSAGGRRGLLLPDLDGVDTAEDQVRIARRKGGIRPTDPVTLQRFTVRKEVQPA